MKINNFVTSTVAILLKIANLDLFVAGTFKFHKHILFHLNFVCVNRYSLGCLLILLSSGLRDLCIFMLTFASIKHEDDMDICGHHVNSWLDILMMVQNMFEILQRF